MTVVDRLRVRSEPRITGDSIKLEPVLPTGTSLFVLDGPVRASGYTWYKVIPTTFDGLLAPGFGWISSADRDGQPWIEPTEIECPPTPQDATALVRLPRGLILACFARQPIEFDAQLGVVAADIDYIPYQMPSRFQPIAQSDPSLPVFIFDVGATDLAPFSSSLPLRVADPSLVPERLGSPVHVRLAGHFDDPASIECRRPDSGSQGDWPGETDESAVMHCRTSFILTSIAPVD